MAKSHERAQLGERAYRQVCGRNVTVALAVSLINGLVFHAAFLGGMNGERFTNFLAEVRIKVDPEEEIIFIYDDAPTDNNAINARIIIPFRSLILRSKR